jgi:hypothetical protein
VEKNVYPTPKQAQKKVAIAKSSRLHKLSCGNSKTATPTKRAKEKVISTLEKGNSPGEIRTLVKGSRGPYA